MQADDIAIGFEYYLRTKNFFGVSILVKTDYKILSNLSNDMFFITVERKDVNIHGEKIELPTIANLFISRLN